MPFRWKAFLELARELAKQALSVPESEAYFRTALGRTYFSAFCHARDFAIEYLGYSAKDHADDHGALRAHLKNKRRKGDANRLDRLRQLRNEADYSLTLSTPELPTAVAEAIDACERVFASLMVVIPDAPITDS